jgi:cellulose synthase/poly-beta-1,6-N-acetylglucosamine synthase-like glycosyltransferase
MSKNNQVPFVSIVIIVRNMQDTIGRCIQSLVNQNISQDKYEIIVIDNNSNDSTRQIIQEYPVRLFSEQLVGNFGGARNTGVKESRGNIVAFVDADCTVGQDYIRKIIDFHSSNTHIAGMAGSLANPYPRNKVARTICYGQCGFWSTNAPKRFVKFLTCANSSYQKDVLLEVGMFPEGTASEDILLGWKLTAKGKKLLFDPSYRIVHDFDRTLYMLALKEERCGTAHFNMHSSNTNTSIAKLVGGVLFAPIFMIGRTATGFQRMLKFSPAKQDAIFLFHYLVYSGFFWSIGYLKQAFYATKTQK